MNNDKDHYRSDFHVHTAFSDDSKCPMEEMVQKAIDLGLSDLCFTEHVDYGIKTDLNCHYGPYFEEVHRLQKQYHDVISIHAGIEFGVQMEYLQQYQNDAASWPFEFILLSIHEIHNQEFWTQAFQQGKTEAEFQQEYYSAMLEVIRSYHDYDVLSHLDLIKRYDRLGDYPDERIMPTVAEILRQIIADGRGIEINTSSWHYGLKDTTPSRAILQRYHDLGGTNLTIGSDAHDPAYLADHRKDAVEILKSCGFTQYCTYTDRKPVFHPL